MVEKIDIQDELISGEFVTYKITKDDLLKRFSDSLEEVDGYVEVSSYENLRDFLNTEIFDVMGEFITSAYGVLLGWDIFEDESLAFAEYLFPDFNGDIEKHLKIISDTKPRITDLGDEEGYYITFENSCEAKPFNFEEAGLGELVDVDKVDYSKFEIVFSKVWITNQLGEIHPYAHIESVLYDGEELPELYTGHQVEDFCDISAKLYHVDSEGRIEDIFNITLG